MYNWDVKVMSAYLLPSHKITHGHCNLIKANVIKDLCYNLCFNIY